MIRFKKMLKETKKHKICFCENENVTLYWPIVDGWTSDSEFDIGYDNEKEYVPICYFNDDKNFIVWFTIMRGDDIFSEQTIKYDYKFWGIKKNEKFKSIKSIKSILKKVEKEYDIAKKEALKKIPSFAKWKRVVNDIEISFSRKQRDRTVIVRISDIHKFIKNYFGVNAFVNVYNDFLDNRIAEKSYLDNGSRYNIKNLISKLNDLNFKDE